MKPARIIIALALSLAVLYIARTYSTVQPQTITTTTNGFTFTYETVPKALEMTSFDINVKVDGDIDSTLSVVFKSSKYGQDIHTPHYQYTTTPMTLLDSTSNIYTTTIQTGKRGQNIYYYFVIRDNTGGQRAVFLPQDTNAFTLRFIGDIPNYVLALHIVFLFATAFLVTIAALQGLDILTKSAPVAPLSKTMVWVVLCTFIAGYPIGFMMNQFGYGGFWEGIPFGTNVTDNKSQLLFVYMFIVLLGSIGSLTGGKTGKDAFSSKTIGKLAIFGFFLLVLTYLTPHSLQLSPTLINTICYGFISLILIAYTLGLLKHQKGGVTKKGRKTSA